ncbi:MAG: GerAB/ArcD/ProY family transporter [Clostridiales bacterium]|nr:GerAB/ArcD/ProY family transporter [Clostridiales bacterium]
MRFAENNRISHRQLYRQLLLAFLPPFLLCVTGKSWFGGWGGILGLAAALGLLLFYRIFLIRLAPACGALLKTAGGPAGWGIGLFFLVYVILTGAYLLAVLGEIVPQSLLTGVSGRWISFWAAAVCCVGTHRGMQRRGRMAEVSGMIFLGGIFLMMVLCLGQVRISSLAEGLGEPELSVESFLAGSYGFLCAFSGVSLLPFAMKEVEKQGSTGKTMTKALLTAGGILLGMQLLLPAVFGGKRLAAEEYPILPLLSGADLPGNVLARFDVIWMGLVLYGILFSLGSLLHYGSQLLRQLFPGNPQVQPLPFRLAPAGLALLMFAFSLAEIRGNGIRDYYESYLAFVFVPVLLLAQVFLSVRNRGKRKRRRLGAGIAMLLGVSMFLGGCAAVEPENRNYPLALGVDWDGENLTLSYGMPDLPEATGQEKTEENGISLLSLSGVDFEEIEAAYSRSQEKILDMGHLEVLILGEPVLGDKVWERVLEYLKEEPSVGEDVYVFRSAGAREVLSWDGARDTSVGEYITGMLENPAGREEKASVTLREVYYAWYESGTLPELPEISVQGDLLVLEEALTAVSDRDGEEKETASLLAWWGTLYPEFCFAESSGSSSAGKTGNSERPENVKFSFWLAQIFK